MFPEYGLTGLGLDNLSGDDFHSLSQLVPDPLNKEVFCHQKFTSSNQKVFFIKIFSYFRF